MAWTDSRVFTQSVLSPLTASVWTTAEPTGYATSGLSADTVNVALFNTSTAPDRDAAVTSIGFNTGTWTTGAAGNEVTDPTNWTTGGRTLASKTFNLGTSVVAFDAADTTGAGNVTISAAFGCLVYDNSITGGTVAKQGMSFNYFGGTQSVTGGTFTIVWDATGIFKFTT